MALETKTHYVDNAAFLEELILYKRACRLAKKEGGKIPPISDYLGECFMKIAQHLVMRSNFNGYTYRDDMVSEGIENCITYIHNFNPAKSKNPFAYFTQIIYYAFIRRIQREKKQQYIKFKVFEDSQLMDELAQTDSEGNYHHLPIRFVAPRSVESYESFIERKSNVFKKTLQKTKKVAPKKKKVIKRRKPLTKGQLRVHNTEMLNELQHRNQYDVETNQDIDQAFHFKPTAPQEQFDTADLYNQTS